MKKHIREVMIDSRTRRYGLAAFSVHNAEMIDSVLSVSKKLSVPVLLQLGQKALQHLDMAVQVSICREFEKLYSIPVYLHLDHSRNLEQIRRAIEIGFDSVMYDGSALPWEQNVENTKQVVAMAKPYNTVVEAEIGKIAGVEDDISVRESDAYLTSPEEAKDFVDATGVDWLAVSIGTAHGWYKDTPQLDYPRIEAIRSAVSTPLVMHGGSGLSDQAFSDAIKAGISKINVDTELRRAFMGGLSDSLASGHAIEDLLYHFKLGRQSLTSLVREKLFVFGTQKF
ncbi:MAG: class II fructose-bisphosphate aldolase [Desulfitobacterium hafniense]|nr:class II fructose-bisphosphate aldolase [Desulfitobacterium hafniense]